MYCRKLTRLNNNIRTQSGTSLPRVWWHCWLWQRRMNSIKFNSTSMVIIAQNIDKVFFIKKLLYFKNNYNFCRAMLSISAAIVVMRCPSVCLSVTFVSCAKTNKDIFEFFSPSGSQAILVFPCQTGWRYSDGNQTPLTGASNAGGVGRNRDAERISGTYGLSSTASLPRNANWSISRPFPY